MKAVVVATEEFPAVSLSTAVTVPDGCAATDVALYTPLVATVALAVVPSGNVIFTMEPGSPVPEAVSVPLAFCVAVRVGAKGAVMSV